MRREKTATEYQTRLIYGSRYGKTGAGNVQWVTLAAMRTLPSRGAVAEGDRGGASREAPALSRHQTALAIQVRRPPLSCRTSPPQGGRLDVTDAFANLQPPQLPPPGRPNPPPLRT
ncbi:MAG: hypothetical protein E5Y51_26550 [Mesorhizobium sp.]|nr:MAG: hypothetical protein E5Y51_26550 [Mesorhizobium sp.]